MIRGAELKVYQPSLNKCTHINWPLQLLVQFDLRQERTPDEKELTKWTDNSIEKQVRPRHVAAQNVDILRRLTIEDEWPLSLGEACVNITLIYEALWLVYFSFIFEAWFVLRRVSLEVKFIRNGCALFTRETSIFC